MVSLLENSRANALDELDKVMRERDIAHWFTDDDLKWSNDVFESRMAVKLEYLESLEKDVKKREADVQELEKDVRKSLKRRKDFQEKIGLVVSSLACEVSSEDEKKLVEFLERTQNKQYLYKGN